MQRVYTKINEIYYKLKNPNSVFSEYEDIQGFLIDSLNMIEYLSDQSSTFVLSNNNSDEPKILNEILC